MKREECVSPDYEATPTPEGSAGVTAGHFDERLNRLSEEVGAIQVQLAEKRKPWHRQYPLLVSIVALLFTVGNTLFTRSSDIGAKGNERLQSIIAQLSEIRTEESKDLLTAKTDFSAYATRTSLRNTKRVALLEDADAALAEVKGQAPSAIYLSLGSEAAAESEYPKADKYFTKAIEKADPHTNELMWAKFNAALLRLVTDSPFYNPAEGRRLVEEAVGEVSKDDDNARYQRGQILVRMGRIETLSHNEMSAKSYFARATQEVQKMNPLNPLHDLLNQYVAAASQPDAGALVAGAVIFSQAGTWSGEWVATFPTKKMLRGTVTFVAGTAPNTAAAFVDITSDGQLVEKEIGQVTILDDQHLRIDWNAQRSVPAPSQTAGYTLLRVKPGSRITGEEQAFSEAPLPIELTRPPSLAAKEVAVAVQRQSVR
jgi:tetratricopeptide (TPR) repeat protein